MSAEAQDEDKLMAAKAASRRARFEPVALVLLSLASVGTAWCSFEPAVWRGLSQRLTNMSAASSRRAVTGELQS